MIRIEQSVVVDRPPDEVFAFVSDPTNLPCWQRSCLAARADGPADVGTRITERRRMLGREAETVVEVVELEPPRLLTLEVVEGPIQIRVRHRLEAAAGGTRVEISAEGEPGGLLRFGRRLVVRAVEDETRANLAELKRLLESRPTS